MNISIKRTILCLGLPMAFAVGMNAQKLSGHILSTTNEPVADAIISSPGCETVRSAADGSFTIEGVKSGNALNVWHDGYYQRAVYIRKTDATGLNVYMIEENMTRYNETAVTPFATRQNDPSVVNADNLNRKDFGLGSMSVENALKGAVSGLQVTNKSGMTGEGALIQLRGIHSFVADNAPLIVIDGLQRRHHD